MGEYKMFILSKKLCAATLGLLLLLAATSTANAQSWRGRTSSKEKAAWIGGGAAAGAVIGGLLGGKKGAVIGGLLGAGGGTGVVLYKNNRDNDRYGRYDGYRYRSYRDFRAYDDRRFLRDRYRGYYNGFRR